MAICLVSRASTAKDQRHFQSCFRTWMSGCIFRASAGGLYPVGNAGRSSYKSRPRLKLRSDCDATLISFHSQTPQGGASESLRQKPASGTGARGGRQEHPSKYANRDRQIAGHSLVRLGRKETSQRLQRLLPELVDHGHLVYAGYGAIGGTGLDGVVFMLQMLRTVLIERNAGKTTLLRTVMDESILADIEIATAGMTMPGVGESAHQVFLELVVIGEC